LIELIKKNNYFLPELSNLSAEEDLMNTFDIENIDIVTLLYQTGYLTITEIIKDEENNESFKLYFPNKEVKKSFLNHIINYFT